MVANCGFLDRTGERREISGGDGDELVCAVRMQMLTGSEYMALMVSLNCMVAVTKMASVAESCFPLERKSFTCLDGTEMKSHRATAAVQQVTTAAVGGSSLLAK